MRRDLEVLGVPWPPPRNWINDYLGESTPPKRKKSKQKHKRPAQQPANPITSSKEYVIIYTDGGAWPNPGIGGWGAVITMPDGKVVELTGGEMKTSNNRMELMGPIAALESLPPGSSVLVYSDSQYVVNGITSWVAGWKNKGWVSKKKESVKNRDLWERLDQARSRHSVTFQWVRGHCGIAGNERADRLSQKGAVEACGHEIDFTGFVLSYATRSGIRMNRSSK